LQSHLQMSCGFARVPRDGKAAAETAGVH
jgi:hypothetical protein